MIGQDGHGSPKPAGPNLMNIEHRFDCNCIVDTDHDAECYISIDAAGRTLLQRLRLHQLPDETRKSGANQGRIACTGACMNPTGLAWNASRPLKRFTTIVIPALALWSAAAFAEMFGSDYKPCAEKPSTMEIVDCVQARTKVWDDRLNAAYRDLLKRITPDQRQPLMQAELLWIQYRDANCKILLRWPGHDPPDPDG